MSNIDDWWKAEKSKCWSLHWNGIELPLDDFETAMEYSNHACAGSLKLIDTRARIIRAVNSREKKSEQSNNFSDKKL